MKVFKIYIYNKYFPTPAKPWEENNGAGADCAGRKRSRTASEWAGLRACNSAQSVSEGSSCRWKLTKYSNPPADNFCKLTKTSKRTEDGNCKVTKTSKRAEESNCKVTKRSKRAEGSNCKVTKTSIRLKWDNCKVTKASKRLDEGNCKVTKRSKCIEARFCKFTSTSNRLAGNNCCAETASGRVNRSFSGKELLPAGLYEVNAIQKKLGRGLRDANVTSQKLHSGSNYFIVGEAFFPFLNH